VWEASALEAGAFRSLPSREPAYNRLIWQSADQSIDLVFLVPLSDVELFSLERLFQFQLQNVSDFICVRQCATGQDTDLSADLRLEQLMGQPFKVMPHKK